MPESIVNLWKLLRLLAFTYVAAEVRPYDVPAILLKYHHVYHVLYFSFFATGDSFCLLEEIQESSLKKLMERKKNLKGLKSHLDSGRIAIGVDQSMSRA
jgi:hypothetical protein